MYWPKSKTQRRGYPFLSSSTDEDENRSAQNLGEGGVPSCILVESPALHPWHKRAKFWRTNIFFVSISSSIRDSWRCVSANLYWIHTVVLSHLGPVYNACFWATLLYVRAIAPSISWREYQILNEHRNFENGTFHEGDKGQKWDQNRVVLKLSGPVFNES